MLDIPPAESPRASWTYVAIAVLVVFSTIPLARALREAIDASVGRDIFLYLVALLLVIGGVYAVLNLRRRALPRGAFLWLGLVFLVFGIVIY